MVTDLVLNYLFNMSDPSISIKKTKFIPMFNDSHASKLSNASFSISSNKRLLSPLTISATETRIGHGKITYLDISPILSQFFQNKISGDATYRMLGNSGNMIRIELPHHVDPNYNSIRVLFTSLIGRGNIQANTTSVIFPSDTPFSQISIKYGGKKINSFENVTNLNIRNYHKAILDMDSYTISLRKGEGLYRNLILSPKRNLPFTLQFKDNTTTASGSSEGRSLQLVNISAIYISNGKPIHLFIRQPTLNINGNSILKELYSGDLRARTGVEGQDFIVSGNVSLDMFMSDSHSLASHIFVDGYYAFKSSFAAL